MGRWVGGSVLLYPMVKGDFLPEYVFMGQRLAVVSVDLAVPWLAIHDRLLLAVRRLGADLGSE